MRTLGIAYMPQENVGKIPGKEKFPFLVLPLAFCSNFPETQ